MILYATDHRPPGPLDYYGMWRKANERIDALEKVIRARDAEIAADRRDLPVLRADNAAMRGEIRDLNEQCAELVKERDDARETLDNVKRILVDIKDVLNG